MESIKAQLFECYEVLIVDDGSTDGSLEIVRSWIEENMESNRFVCYSKENGGPASARNYAIRKSKGQYLAFLDVDDVWLESKLSTVKDQIVNSEKTPDILSHEVVIKGEEKDRYLKCGSNGSFEGFLRYGNTLITSATVVKRSWVLDVGLFDERKEMIGTEDYDLWLSLLGAGASIKMISVALAEYYVEEDSLSQNYERMISNHISVIEKHVAKSHFSPRDQKTILRDSHFDTLYKIGRRLQINGGFEDAKGYYFRALKLKKNVLKVWVMTLSCCMRLRFKRGV